MCCGCGTGSVIFGPPGSGSGSISQKYISKSGSFYHQAKIIRQTLRLRKQCHLYVKDGTNLDGIFWKVSAPAPAEAQKAVLSI
jgi:hypothetical protein